LRIQRVDDIIAWIERETPPIVGLVIQKEISSCTVFYYFVQPVTLENTLIGIHACEKHNASDSSIIPEGDAIVEGARKIVANLAIVAVPEVVRCIFRNGRIIAHVESYYVLKINKIRLNLKPIKITIDKFKTVFNRALVLKWFAIP